MYFVFIYYLLCICYPLIIELFESGYPDQYNTSETNLINEVKIIRRMSKNIDALQKLKPHIKAKHATYMRRRYLRGSISSNGQLDMDMPKESRAEQTKTWDQTDMSRR